VYLHGGDVDVDVDADAIQKFDNPQQDKEGTVEG
jgi:hypothetical protein